MFTFSESTAYMFGGGESLITFSLNDSEVKDRSHDELALGVITTETDAVLVGINSQDSDDFIKMELVCRLTTSAAVVLVLCMFHDFVWDIQT